MNQILEGLHALVVEDDPDGCDLLATLLRHCGATVTTADSVNAALAAIERQAPDVLVSDIGLPGEDGLSLIRRLRESSRFRGLPAVALTAYCSKRDVAAALAAGFQEHVVKPVQVQVLSEAIARVSGR